MGDGAAEAPPQRREAAAGGCGAHQHGPGAYHSTGDPGMAMRVWSPFLRGQPAVQAVWRTSRCCDWLAQAGVLVPSMWPQEYARQDAVPGLRRAGAFAGGLRTLARARGCRRTGAIGHLLGIARRGAHGAEAVGARPADATAAGIGGPDDAPAVHFSGGGGLCGESAPVGCEGCGVALPWRQPCGRRSPESGGGGATHQRSGGQDIWAAPRRGAGSGVQGGEETCDSHWRRRRSPGGSAAGQRGLAPCPGELREAMRGDACSGLGDDGGPGGIGGGGPAGSAGAAADAGGAEPGPRGGHAAAAPRGGPGGPAGACGDGGGVGSPRGPRPGEPQGGTNRAKPGPAEPGARRCGCAQATPSCAR